MLKTPGAKTGIIQNRERAQGGLPRRTRGPAHKTGGDWGKKIWHFVFFAALAGAASLTHAATNDLRITTILPQNGKIIVRWQGGKGPFQLLCKTNMLEDWRKVGASTSGFAVTNPIPSGPACLFLVTTDLAPPTAPGGFQVSPIGCSQLLLKWNASTDGTNGAGVKSYRIFRNGVFLKQVPATATSVTDDNLGASTTYSYRVSAMDFVGNESTQTVAVAATTPSCTNAPPVASAGPDQTNKIGGAANFNATSSRDIDGAIVSYLWNFGDGTSTTGTNVAHAFTNSGTFTVTLKVTDNLGAVATDTALVVVTNTPNRLPVANAGADQTNKVGAALTFSSTGSQDPDGSIVAYNWNFGDGSSATGANVSHAFTNTGTFTVRLTVSDNSGASASDTSLAVVTNASNRPPLANAGPDQTGAPGTSLAFNGSSSSDPDGTIASYSWNFGDGSTGAGMNVAHAYTSSGSFTVTLTVTDNLGAQATDTASVNIAAAAPVGQLLTVANFGSTDIDIGQAMARDGFGNVFIGGGLYSHPFLAKQASTGSNLWNFMIDGPGTGSIRAMATDQDGNVYITGNMLGSLYFGSSPIASIGGSDIFIAKYSSNGVHQWSKRFGSNNGNAAVDESGYGIAIDTVNNCVVVTGNFDSTVDFGGGPLTSTSGQDLFVVKLSYKGDHVWSKRVGGSSGAIGTGVAIDKSSNILLTGNFSAAVDFGRGPVAALGSMDVFVAKYTAAGSILWVKHFGTNSPYMSTAAASSIAVDSSDNVIIGGNYQLDMSFGGTNLTYNGYGDMFIAKYSGADGSHIWSKGFGGAGMDQCNSVAIGRNDDIYLTGKPGSALNFGGGALPFTSGQMNIFVTCLKLDGTYRWAKGYGVGLGESKALTVDSLGNVDVTGNYSSASFGGAPLPNAGLRDIFVLKFTP